MEDYIGKICPFCKTEIKEGDSVKVCPACGIPHHESCWEENHGCTTFGCSEQHYEEQHTNPTDVCQNCGAPLGDGQKFCPKCGTPKNAPKKNVCGKCGAELQEGQEFCPKCGQKVGLAVDSGVSSAINQFNSGVEKKNKKKAMLPITLGVVAAIVVVLFLVLRGPSVEEIVLSKSSIELKVDDSTTVSYTISPDKAADADVTWKSSNESVATVSNNGKITGKSEGSCTITVTAGGKTDTLTVTVKEGPDFQKIFDECGLDTSYATVASDGSYLSVDTNPKDKDDYTDYAAYLSLYLINDMLGLPDSLMEDMGHTSSIDGKQTETFEDVTVTWKYHPDRGLEVTYKAN